MTRSADEDARIQATVAKLRELDAYRDANVESLRMLAICRLLTERPRRRGRQPKRRRRRFHRERRTPR